MSTCILTSGIARGCKDNAGGIKRFLIQNTVEVESFTPAIGGTADFGAITAITMIGATSYFYEFIPNKQSSNYVENVQSNMANGTVGFEQVVTMVFAKNEATKRNQVKILAAAEVYVIIEDYNGKYFLLGEENGLELGGGNSGSGTTLTDLNGWNVQLNGFERHPAREIFDTNKATTDALVNALLES